MSTRHAEPQRDTPTPGETAAIHERVAWVRRSRNRQRILAALYQHHQPALPGLGLTGDIVTMPTDSDGDIVGLPSMLAAGLVSRRDGGKMVELHLTPKGVQVCKILFQRPARPAL